MPLSFEIKIPFDSEARTFDEVFRRIDFRQYIETDKSGGRIGYNPVNMLKLILFCMMENITTLREMEKAAKNDIRIMWLTDELKPSHQTINQFMKERLKGNIEGIFHEINRYIIKKEQIEVEKLYINDPKRPVNFKKDEQGNYYDENDEQLVYLWHSKKGHDVYEVPSSKRRVDIHEELWALQKEARENLQSEMGIVLRVQRSIQVEGAFGVIKENMGMRRFRRRGVENVKFEFILVAIGYNLFKLHKKKFRLS